jgi:hypothetical protein
VSLAIEASAINTSRSVGRCRCASSRTAITNLEEAVRACGSGLGPLVRGRDSGGHFDLLPPPEGEFHPAALARHEEAYRRYRANYAEQIEAHDRAFASVEGVAPRTALDPALHLIGRAAE